MEQVWEFLRVKVVTRPPPRFHPMSGRLSVGTGSLNTLRVVSITTRTSQCEMLVCSNLRSGQVS